MKKISAIVFLIFLGLQFSCAQTVKERVLTEKDKERDEINIAKAYFAKKDECRELFNEEKIKEAEISCRESVAIAENLPETRYPEKHSAYKYLGLALLLQDKADEAVIYLNKSLEISKPHLNDTDSETGEVYYFLGQANQLLGKFELAREFYTKAENAFREAYKKTDADEPRRQFYQKEIKVILKSHLNLVKSAGLEDEAIKIQKKLDNLKTEFPNFLDY